jgi:predicted peptidase
MTSRVTPGDYQKRALGPLQYRYLAPLRAEAGRRYPLVIFLHGVGECGTDNESQLWYPFFSDESSIFSASQLGAFPCHVVAPQAQDDNRWVDIHDWSRSEVVLAPGPTPALASVIDLVRNLSSAHDVDPGRIYLTGLSMGAFGVYELLVRAGELFAAAVAVCGGADFGTVDRIRQTPLRIYHGARDKVVPVELSRVLYEALRAMGAGVVYQELEQTGHNAWEYAFRDPELMRWMFAFGKTKP